jgi:4-amino-4-deoxy-L-arabinose transferase-like glycosyltransferase
LRLTLVLFVAALLSSLWAVAVPLDSPGYAERYGNWFPDEADHLAVARHWARFWQPPPYEPPYMTSSHPPLYHSLTGLLLRIGGERLILVRLVSLVCGLGTLMAIWQAVRLLYGRDVALLATAIAGLVPTRLALSAGASNENLATLLAALTLALLAKITRHGATRLQLVLLGACLVLGFGAKVTCLGLFLAALPVLTGRLGWGRAVGLLVLYGMALLGLWSGWLLWNRAHYGDWLKTKAAHAYWDQRAPGFLAVHVRTEMSLFRYLLGIAVTGFRSFWATFAGMDRPLPLALYAPLVLWSGAGLHEALRRQRRVRATRRWWAGVGLYALFLFAVFVGYNWLWFSAQGRYLYGLLTPVGILLARAYLRPFPVRVRKRAGMALVAALVLLNAACLAIYPPWR